MKKKTLKHLSFKKATVSKLGGKSIMGGSPTTDQSQYCPVPPIQLPGPEIHSLNPIDCPTRSCNSLCISVCEC